MAEEKWYFDALDPVAGAGFVGWRKAQHAPGDAEPQSLDHPCFFVRAPHFQPEALGSAALAAGAAHRGFLPALLNEDQREQGFDSLEQASEFLRRAYVQSGSDGSPAPGGDGPGFPPSDGGDGGRFEGEGIGLTRAMGNWPAQGGELNWAKRLQLEPMATHGALSWAGLHLLGLWVNSQPSHEDQALHWWRGALELVALSAPLALDRGWREPFWELVPDSPLWRALPTDAQRALDEARFWGRHPRYGPSLDWPWPFARPPVPDAWSLLRRQPCSSGLALELGYQNAAGMPIHLQQALLRFLARPAAFQLSPASEALLLWAAAAVACQSLGPAASRNEVLQATLDWLRQSLPRFAFSTSVEALLLPAARPPKSLGVSA